MTVLERPVHELRGCELLRHDVGDRYVGDLVGRVCHSCGDLWFTDAATSTRPGSQLGARVSGASPRSNDSDVLPVAMAIAAGARTG